ncbi:hypothetical protein BY996DRAFT_6916913 [Phakopsora pachyrhizi]|uniref:Hikeshi-like domain-containing protein n=1 Tax=Phakopsora pachyrhizi TaxID=170000 RepID=A0AAV0B5W9_PHAPC|nr:hypothetical protein BY996DRAFT_4583500 [Phakopsora pachyrhizi]KAI8457333.1 hypothetical protein BY996DRAFT_6916913 [Phakopsora pachyrhizi]CAH7680967.1 hypothetical protein PPACK8108_LOCUS13496 [Phakopsora pachyrhizi]CAH7681848.1 hypothetical protein PPACK8108_LOCUS14508 [Phakopsora pachyrhizi]
MFSSPQPAQIHSETAGVAINPPIFACIIPSRPVQTEATHIPPNRFVFNFENPDAINHLVVFLTGIVPLPEGYGATVHFLFPHKTDWQLLGMLSPEKPSAIFRLRGTASSASSSNWAANQTQIATPMATLGILVAPLEQIHAECCQLENSLMIRPPGSNSMRSTLPEIAKSIGLNLFRYISSFSATTFNNETWVPISVLERWWKQFETKLSTAPNPEQWLLESAQAG